MSEEIYVGQVKWIHDNPETGYRHAGLEPLFKSSNDQENWFGPVESALEEFPGRGLVNWHMPPNGLEQGAYRLFEVEPHPNYQGEPNREKFQATNIDYPSEVIDLRGFGDESTIRALLCSKGVLLGYSPLVERAFLWVSNEKIIGPVNLSKLPGTKSWIFSETKDLVQMTCWKPKAAWIHHAEINGERFLLIPNQKYPGEAIGLETWEPDEFLAKRLLKHLRKLDRELPKAMGFTDRVYNEYITVVEKSGLLGSTSSPELNYYERIKDIFAAIGTNKSLLDEAAEVCFNISHVKQEVEAKAKEEYEKKLLAHDEQLDIDLAAKKSEIKNAEADLTNKRSQLSSVQDQIIIAEQKLAKQVELFDTELTEKLREVAGKPERLFAEMAFSGAISSAIRPASSKPLHGAFCSKHTIIPDAPTIQKPNDFMRALFKRLLSIGVSPQVGQELHCALSSGTVPVLVGADGLDVIRSYADCISGGVFHWIPVGGGLFEPADLLGRVDPSSHYFVPHPGGLLDLLLDDSDAVHLVVLDGFNRAASDGYLLPLIQAIQDAAEGGSQLTIPLVPQGLSRNGDFYDAVHRVAWSRNVLLLLRPSIGTSALPVPREFWTYCAVINTELPVDVTESPEQTSRVGKTDWNIWFDRTLSPSVPIEKLTEHPEASVPLPRGIQRKIERIHGAGMAIGLTAKNATDQALKIGLIPYLATCDEPIDEWTNILGLELEEQDRRVEDIVRRLEE